MGMVDVGSPMARIALARSGEIPGCASRYASRSVAETPVEVTTGAVVWPITRSSPMLAADAGSAWTFFAVALVSLLATDVPYDVRTAAPVVTVTLLPSILAGI